MQFPYLYACKTTTTTTTATTSHPRFYHFLSSPSTSLIFFFSGSSCTFNAKNRTPRKLVSQKQKYSSNGSRDRAKVKSKENVWSVDNDAAKVASMAGKEKARRKRGKGRGGSVRNVDKMSKDDRVMVSGAMLMEVESVLQTQEPVIRPVWSTFASSVSGIWKGVGAVFSPITAEMEPIDVGDKNEYLYDCYTLSRIEAVPSSSGGRIYQVQRKISWVTLNPYGEIRDATGNRSKEEQKDAGVSLPMKKIVDGSVADHDLPKFEFFDFGTSDIMEEDFMGMEPGLVFFEDGSYSRGPGDIPVGEVDESNKYVSPTFKFEQCLVKGCHKRLRIVHTIEYRNGGSEIQVMRVAVYEEEWVSPANLPHQSDTGFDLRPFSQRKRIQPSQLSGFWEVFEMSATPIYGDDAMVTDEANGTPYVYLCTETLKYRSLPETSLCFGEEEIHDTQDVSIIWLPGGVTGYVDVNKDGILCIGVGWYSDEGINLVMERDYGVDGKLKEVRSKTEVKTRE